MTNGGVYHIDFSGYMGSEINSIHLDIIFKLPNVKNMVFCACSDRRFDRAWAYERSAPASLRIQRQF